MKRGRKILYGICTNASGHRAVHQIIQDAKGAFSRALGSTFNVEAGGMGDMRP